MGSRTPERITEADLEARVHHTLRSLFPSIEPVRIRHQKTFSIKLGHGEVEVGGTAGGRLDILVEVDSRPIMVLELKRPGETITDDDRDQCISYARLTDQITPFAVVSNGSDTKLYRTYDKTIFEHTSIDDHMVSTLIEEGLRASLADKDEALSYLLSSNPDIWAALINKSTKETLEQKTGAIDDYRNPLVSNFSISRGIVGDIGSVLLGGEPLIIIKGPPLSGKTNVIAQLSEGYLADGLIVFYVDAVDTRHGVIGYLSDVFSRERFVRPDPQAARHWLINSLRTNAPGRLVIAIDGWNSAFTGTAREDLDELVNINAGGQFSLVIATDEYGYEALRTVDGRVQETNIGKTARVYELTPLTDEEFKGAARYLRNEHEVAFHKGAFYNLDYRNPLLLRLLIGLYSGDSESDSPVPPPGYYTAYFVPSITGVGLLEYLWDVFSANSELRADFVRLALAFIEDEVNRSADIDLALMALATACVKQETAERILGQDRYSRLIREGYLKERPGTGSTTIVYPTVPWFLSVAAAYYLRDELLSVYRDAPIAEASDYLLSKSLFFPFPDLIGAKAILLVSQENEELASKLFLDLLNRPPAIITTDTGLAARTYLDNVGFIEVSIEPGSGLLTKRVEPWLILSHLATYRMEYPDGSPDPRLGVIWVVGSFPYILRQIRGSKLSGTTPVLTHDIPGVGSFLCSRQGILEPIVLAMQTCFYSIPGLMLDFCNEAAASGDFHLCWRLYQAAESTESCSREDVSTVSKSVIEILKPRVSRIEHDVTQKKTTPPHKVGRNDPCPCGSGLKFKKCHGSNK